MESSPQSLLDDTPTRFTLEGSNMKRTIAQLFAVFALALLPFVARGGQGAVESRVDFRYAQSWWQSTICLPDDPDKVVVGKEGQVLLDWGRGWFRNYGICLRRKSSAVPMGAAADSLAAGGRDANLEERRRRGSIGGDVRRYSETRPAAKPSQHNETDRGAHHVEEHDGRGGGPPACPAHP